MKNFALIGAAGYIAPRHMQAIKDTGNQLVAAMDPNDSVGVLDRYFREVRFFTEIERFDRHLEKLRRTSEAARAHYVSICSPNYLHDAHVRLALRLKAHAICEKPLVISPWNLDALADLEGESGCKVYTVLQLRVLPVLMELKKRLLEQNTSEKSDVCLSYITSRGPWYQVSWKGDVEKSGGVTTNIGIHFFDLMIWLYGKVERSEVHLRQADKVAGTIELERAKVRWFLSTDKQDLPPKCLENGKPSFRSLTMNGQEIEFSDGFTDLHTKVYQDILSGGGFGIADAKPSLAVVHDIRTAELTRPGKDSHPVLHSTDWNERTIL